MKSLEDQIRKELFHIPMENDEENELVDVLAALMRSKLVALGEDFRILSHYTGEGVIYDQEIDAAVAKAIGNWKDLSHEDRKERYRQMQEDMENH